MSKTELEQTWDALKDAEREVIGLRKENFWLRKKLEHIQVILNRKDFENHVE